MGRDKFIANVNGPSFIDVLPDNRAEVGEEVVMLLHHLLGRILLFTGECSPFSVDF